MNRWILGLAAAALLVFFPSATGAQTGTGSIAGTVRDATGAVLPGVTVEAFSPALIEKVRTASTDASGQYKIIELPPGVYTVAFGLTGFANVRREGIELTTGFTAPVNVEMRVGSIEETVTVSGQSPIVDTQNVRQQAVMSRDVIDAIPTGKTYGNLGALIPGVVLASAGGQQTQDVGGATGIAFTQLAIHGGRRFDQTLQINGMSVTNLDNESISTINFTDGNVQEIVMDVAAQSAESELGGVRVNIIPKDGGNTFRGSLAANFSTDNLQSDNYSADLQARGLRAPNSIKQLWNVAPGLGGPIVRDKLWFHGAYGTIGTENYVAGMFINTTPAAWTPTFDQGQQAVDDQNTHDANIRLTWQASERNKFLLY
jgi:Carboxypeptidase regulatory-like domain